MLLTLVAAFVALALLAFVAIAVVIVRSVRKT